MALESCRGDGSVFGAGDFNDNFGLAVAIFHLLAMGKHPYAGRFAGGDISMSDAIAQHRFAFSQVRTSETRTTPPPDRACYPAAPHPTMVRYMEMSHRHATTSSWATIAASTPRHHDGSVTQPPCRSVGRHRTIWWLHTAIGAEPNNTMP